LETLVPFGQLELEAETELDILAPFGGQVTLTEGELGSFSFFVAYATADGPVTYNSEPMILTVAGQ
jgi:hypothetical protein